MRRKKICPHCGDLVDPVYLRLSFYGRHDLIPLGYYCKKCKFLFENENFGGLKWWN